MWQREGPLRRSMMALSCPTWAAMRVLRSTSKRRPLRLGATPPLTILAGNLRARGAGRVVSSLARAGRSATRGRRRRRWVAAFIFRDGDGDGWQDRRGAVAVAAAAGAEIWAPGWHERMD